MFHLWILINGGVERGTLDIARELIERGYRLKLSSGGLMAEKYKYKGVNHHVIEISKGLLALARQKFEKLLNIIKPDIVHIRSRCQHFVLVKLLKIKVH